MADVAELLIQPVHRVEIGHRHDVVHLPCAISFLVDRADFNGEHEAHITVTRSRDLTVDLIPMLLSELIQTLLGRLQRVLEFLQPYGVREISRADDSDPLQIRPLVQALWDQIATGGT